MAVKNGLIVMAGILFVASLVGCGSVSSTGGDSQGGAIAGKVGILIKDDLLTHPSSTSTSTPSLSSMDIPELSQLWVTVNRVSLKMDGEMEDEGWLTVFEGTARRYDLLTLQDNKSALMSLVPVTVDQAGYYEKARLEIDETPGKNCFYALTMTADVTLDNPCADPEAYQLTVPSGKVDIEFNPHIYLGTDTTQYIVFDMLPADSIHITDTNGQKGYLLRPEVHAYTMPAIVQDKGWEDIKVEELEGSIAEIGGCDDPDLPDTLIFSPEHGGVNISIDITGADIYLHDSNEQVNCSLLQPGQEVEANVHLSSDGSMTAERVGIEESEHP